MKAVFLSFYQAFYEDVVHVMDNQGIKGFTAWDSVTGRGSDDGEPHYGTHAWPTINSAILAFMEDAKVPEFLKAIHQLDLSAAQQGIRAFVLSAETYTDKSDFE